MWSGLNVDFFWVGFIIRENIWTIPWSSILLIPLVMFMFLFRVQVFLFVHFCTRHCYIFLIYKYVKLFSVCFPHWRVTWCQHQWLTVQTATTRRDWMMTIGGKKTVRVVTRARSIYTMSLRRVREKESSGRLKIILLFLCHVCWSVGKREIIECNDEPDFHQGSETDEMWWT